MSRARALTQSQLISASRSRLPSATACAADMIYDARYPQRSTSSPRFERGYPLRRWKCIVHRALKLNGLAEAFTQPLDDALYAADVIALGDNERAQRLPRLLPQYPYPLPVGYAAVKIFPAVKPCAYPGIVPVKVKVFAPHFLRCIRA